MTNQCDVVGRCPELLPYRCDDNACVPSADLCSNRKTCVNDNEHRCRYGRNIGMCYDNDDCADDSTCPRDTPVLYCCMLKND